MINPLKHYLKGTKIYYLQKGRKLQTMEIKFRCGSVTQQRAACKEHEAE